MKHNIDLEKIILGTILKEINTFVKVNKILNENVFFSNENRLVYRACLNIYQNGGVIDIFSVQKELEKQKVQLLENNPIAYYLSKLEYVLIGIENKALQLYEMYVLRELDNISLIISNKTNETGADCFDIVSKIESELKKLTTFESQNVKHISQVHKEIVSDIKEVLAGKKTTGIPTGISILDAQTGGWQKGNLIILAARPGMGKSAVALHFAKHPAIKNRTPVGILSLEMEDYEVGGRLFASQTQLSNTKIIQRRLNAGELLYLENNCEEINTSPIYIDDSPMSTVIQMRNKIKRMVEDLKCELIVIDYLQLISGNSNNREREIAEISRMLKVCAKEMNIPIIALSQLSRRVEERSDKKPILSDLRDSGSIEQDADVVLFLMRPEYYGINEYEYNYNSINTNGLLLIDIAKGRGLQTGELICKFNGETMSITNF